MITYQDVLEAQDRIKDDILRTPLLRIPALDPILGCEVYLKHEGFQFTGSFKLRGATNRLLVMTPEERERGVVSMSSGNHAQGVACAAQRLGIDAVIVMPSDVNPVKLAGVKAFGAQAVLEGTLSSEREARANRFVSEEGRTMVPPYDDDYVRAGQGTIGLEIMADEPDLDVVVVPVGGGGLISGIATAVKGIKPGIRVVGAEPAGAARYSLSQKHGSPQALDSVNTIADGTRTDKANPESFAIIQDRIDELVTASEDGIRQGLALAVSHAHLVAEPSSVLGMAAVLDGNLSVEPTDKVCFVLSGGNNDLALLAEVITSI